MNYFDEEEYREPYNPSQYAVVADEFVAKMKETLKQEVKDHYNSIQKENEILKERLDYALSSRDEVAKRERDITYKEKELENKIKSLDKNFMRDKFTDLLKDIVQKGYAVRSTYIKQEKCNLCDEKRKVEYTSPTGIVVKLDCECNKGKNFYIPSELDLCEITINKRDNGWKDDRLWVKVKYHERDYDDKELDLETNNIFELFNDEIKDLHYSVTYTTKEECQKHCDYLNSKI